LNEFFDGDGDILFAHACKLSCEGIVSKRLGSPYRSGRSAHWVKVKKPKAPAVRREAEEDWGSAHCQEPQSRSSEARGRGRLGALTMSLNTANDPEYWRKRAEEARAVAVQMLDAHTKSPMLGIAQDYEELAKRAEGRTWKPL
jgi:hypothetical protein